MGKISEEELRALFAKFDVTNSGKITESELHSAMALLGIKCTPNSAKRLLRLIDKDGNGTVEWEEFFEFFQRAGDPEELKAMLSEQCQRFFDYKVMVESDPTFAKTFQMPPASKPGKKLVGHSADLTAVYWLGPEKLLSGGIDGELLIWTAPKMGIGATGRSRSVGSVHPDRSIKTSTSDPLYCMSVSSDSDLVVLGFGAKSSNLQVWNIGTADEEKCMLELPGHKYSVYSCCTAADGALVVSGNQHGIQNLHDMQTGAQIASWKGHDSVVYSSRFDASGKQICSCSSDGSVRIFDVAKLRAETDSEKAPYTLLIEDAAASGTVYQAVWRGDHEIISCGDDYCAKRWDMRQIAKGPVACYFGHTAVVRSICLSPDEQFLLTGTNNGSVRMWLTDEMAMIEAMQADAEKEFQKSKRLKEQLEDQMAEGTLADPTELRNAVQQVEAGRSKCDALGIINQERKRMGCTQAKLSMDNGTMLVASLDWLDAGGGIARIACASQDQVVRVFDVDTNPLAVVERWSK